MTDRRTIPSTIRHFRPGRRPCSGDLRQEVRRRGSPDQVADAQQGGDKQWDAEAIAPEVVAWAERVRRTLSIALNSGTLHHAGDISSIGIRLGEISSKCACITEPSGTCASVCERNSPAAARAA